MSPDQRRPRFFIYTRFVCKPPVACIRPGVRERFLSLQILSTVDALSNGARDVASSYDVGTACKKAPSDHTAAARLYHGLSPHIRLGRWAVLTHAKAQGRRPPPSALGRPPFAPDLPKFPRPLRPNPPKAPPPCTPTALSRLVSTIPPARPVRSTPYDPEVDGGSRLEGPWLPLAHSYGPTRCPFWQVKHVPGASERR